MKKTNNQNDQAAKLVVIDQSKMVSMSNHSIESRVLENYGLYGMKLAMIGVVGAYAFDGKNYDPTVFIKFSVENFAKLINKEEKYAISIFKKTCALLRSKEIVIPGYIDDKEAKFITGILDTYAYSHDEKTLAIKFHPAFMPHFMEMSGNFTQHELSYVLSLDRLDSISFYRFLKMKIGKEFKKIIEGKEYYIEIDENILRKFFNVEEKYTRQRDLKAKILDRIAEEISSQTDLTIAFEFGQMINTFNVTFAVKGDKQKPGHIALSDFKLTKQKNVRRNSKVIKTVEKNGDIDKKEDPTSTENILIDSSKPTPQPGWFRQQPGIKVKLTQEEIETISNEFIEKHPKESSLILELVDKGIITFKKSPRDLIFYILNTYQSRYSSEGLKDYVSNELAGKIGILYSENIKKTEVASLSALGVFFS